MKSLFFIPICALAGMVLSSCGKDDISAFNSKTDSSSSTTQAAGTDDTGSDIDTDAADDYVAATTFGRTVTVTFSSGGASVSGADGLKISTSGNDVTITNSGEEVILYVLTGSTSDGFFKLYSERKQGIKLSNLNLTNPAGAAINNQSGKRTFIIVEGENTIADGSEYSDENDDEDMKAAIFSEGQLIFSGDGSLTVTASGKSGITSDDYVRFIDPNTTINISSSAGHGVRGKDAIIVTDGTIDVSVSGTGKKGFSSDTLVYFGGGYTKITASGSAGTVDDELTGAAGIKADLRFVIEGGKLEVTSTGKGCKGINSDNVGYFKGGQVIVNVTGDNYGTSSSSGMGMGGPGMGGPGGWGGSTSDSDSNSKSAKGIKFDGNLYFSDSCYVVVNCKSHEAIESKGAMTISGGTVYGYSRADDAINASGDMNIEGGYVFARSAGNDGLDANGNLYIKGGVVYAAGATSPEVAIDANTEGGKKLYIKGGTVVAFGGIENNSSISVPYVSSSYTKSKTYALLSGDNALFCFKSPESGGNGLYIFSDQLKSGSSYSLAAGVTTSGGSSYLSGNWIEDATISGGSSSTVSAK